MPGKPHSVTGLQPPKHISFSAREQLERCAKSFFLSRMAHAPQRPALWLAGGSAVHEVTEAWDRASVDGELDLWRDIESVWNVAFGAHLAKLYKADPNEWNWRRSSSEPIERWNVIGPEFVQSYIDWRQRSPYEIWTTPDGLPAIELDISGYLPGCPVEIKAYLDRVFVDPFLNSMAVVDLKSGKTKPTSGLQFGVYGALLQVKYDVHPVWGAALMTREGALHKPYSLGKYSPEYVGKQLGALERIVEARAFPANVGGHCWNCDVSASCYANDGSTAEYFDDDHPAYAPPF